MSSFLSEKVTEIIQAHIRNLDEITVIIPNKRAAVYLQAEISRQLQRPTFSPQIITINEWVSNLTEEKILNQHELIFLLFDVHQSLQTTQEPFNDFIKWGKSLLADFDEIDRYLINTKSIFNDLRNIKEIEYWSFNDASLSTGQEKFLHFWNQLTEYYSRFEKLLKDRNEIYQGKAYRNLAERIQEATFNQKHIYFLGFNALSASEEKIISHLMKAGIASFETEIDQSYFLNPEHEAGYFYRHLLEKWKIKPKTVSHFDARPKNIHIIETAQQLGQARIAGDILNELQSSGANLNSTAVVLADESLLIPLLKTLPDNLETVNITMGYPLKYSHLKSLIDLIFDLQFNFQKFRNSKLYHKSLLKVLDHNYIESLIQNKAKLIQLESDIIENNHVFIDWDYFTNSLPELVELTSVFTLWDSPAKNGFNAMNQLVKSLYNQFKTSSEDRTTELELLYQFALSYKKFEEIWKEHPHDMDLKSFKRMFYQFWQSETLSFLGNPIEGVQVMGILETRLLDFENLIILGMNEGNLPQNSVSNSFIPYDLKKFQNLPTEEDRQAIFAHHFYRLLHRAKNIFMTYNSGSDEGTNGEKSRYITQLENELNYAAGHVIHHRTYSSEDKSAQINPSSYKSEKSVHVKLDHYFSEKGLSPSALNKLINCPLDFYYRYILEMKENEQVEENIESSTFGTKIHDVLETIFRSNFLEKNLALDATVLKKEKLNLEKYLREKYLETFTPAEIEYGQNRLSFEVSLDFLNRFIDKQIEEISGSRSPIYIMELEKKLEHTIQLKINNETKHILMSGLVDRVDQTGDMTRIIDYKSGKCDDDKVVIPESYISKNEIHKLIDHDKKGYARQLLMYALMYRNSLPDKNSFTAGIISMINISDWLQNVRVGSSGSPVLNDDLLNEFEKAITEKIAQLYHPDFVFEHNPDSQYCEHCSH